MHRAVESVANHPVQIWPMELTFQWAQTSPLHATERGARSESCVQRDAK